MHLVNMSKIDGRQRGIREEVSMASKTRGNASLSSSSSAARRCTYDVFLSFRGEDVRKTFVDHLYFALDQKGIFTFKDDERLERGKSISPELLKAIEESRFSVVVFSRNYAASSWCLDELAKIMEWSKSRGQTVFPVFYDVDPSDVRKQTGDFGKVFAKHESEKVGIWREALVEAANSSGWDLKNTADGRESKCIQQIVDVILCKLGNTFSSVVENLVGIEYRMKKVNSLLGMGSDDVRFVGIWGLSGIGKTTITRAIFDRISNQFEGGSFLHEVREASKKHGLEHLQEKLLSEILMVKNLKINNVYEGSNMIRIRLRYKRVLVVLDDVDNLHQLDALAGKHDWFGSGSRIIITTRDKQLLVGHEVDRIHKVCVLNDDEAIQLFSWKAFKKIHPTKDYEELSYRVVHYAGGLPLALRVLGSALYGRDMTKWRSVLDRLMKEGPEGEILEKLKISFDGLNDMEKKIFLDIACFFKGKKKDTVTRMLDSFGFYPDIGISVLLEKSLISLSKNRLCMHQLIQEMGWHIVRQNSPEEPEKHSRLWITEDITHVLTRSTVTTKVEGILLDLPEPRDINVRTGAFTMMNKLRLLKIHNMYGSPGPEYLPNELRWLNWHGFPSKSLPPSFQAEKLVGLKMCYSRIVHLWKGKRMLDKLKYINLSHSQKLIRTLEFSETPNLERLVLKGCTSLVEIHSSIGVLKTLVFINLMGCENLRSLPNNILLESLEILILSGCLKLEKFPEILENREHLLEVHLDGTAIRELPSSIEHLTNLVLINLRGCKNLTSVPSTICMLKRLKILILSGCSKLDKLPEDMGNLEHLLEVYLGETAIREIPSSIEHITSLVLINLSDCKNLTSLPSSICMLKRLKALILTDCSKLDKLPEDLGKLECLEELDLGGTAITQPPPSIVRLKNLKSLSLRGCKGTTSETQTSFSVSWLLPIKRQHSMSLVLPSIAGLCSLNALNLSDCNLLDGTIPSDLGCLVSLNWLNLGRNPFLNIPAESINQLPRLRVLVLEGCKMLEALPELPSSLDQLYVDDCTSLRGFADLLNRNKIFRRISFSNCFQLLEGRHDNKLSSLLWRHLLQGLPVVDDYVFSIYVPGREIPKWFSNQNTGPSISIELPPRWCNNKFMGIALCLVSELIMTPRYWGDWWRCLGHQFPSICAEFSIITHKNNTKFSCGTSICNIGTDKNVDSEHVCLAYITFDWLSLMFERRAGWPNDWRQLEVSICDWKQKYYVPKKWGIRLVYEDDVKLKDEMMMIQPPSQLLEYGADSCTF